jgi:hypothetical protein
MAIGVLSSDNHFFMDDRGGNLTAQPLLKPQQLLGGCVAKSSLSVPMYSLYGAILSRYKRLAIACAIAYAIAYTSAYAMAYGRCNRHPSCLRGTLGRDKVYKITSSHVASSASLSALRLY